MEEIIFSKNKCEKCWKSPVYVGKNDGTSKIGFFCEEHKNSQTYRMPITLEKLELNLSN